MAKHRWDPVAKRVPITPPVRVREGLTPDQARGSRWVQTGPGLYVPAGTDSGLTQQRIIEAAARLPAYAAVTGWAACLLGGAAWFDGLELDGRTLLPVQVALGPRGRTRRHDGITLSFEKLPEWEVWMRYGVRVARPERALFDAMRRHGQREALVDVESALAGTITSLERMRAYALAHRSARRSAVVFWALERARGGARSPLEVRVRTIAEEDAGYGRMLVNRVVYDASGERIGEVDGIEEESGTALEVDGADHREAGQQAWDITKEEALRQVGLEVVRVTGSQARDAETLVPRLRAVRARSKFLLPADRAWRLGPPRPDVETALRKSEDLALFHENLPLPGSEDAADRWAG